MKGYLFSSLKASVVKYVESTLKIQHTKIIIDKINFIQITCIHLDNDVPTEKLKLYPEIFCIINQSVYQNSVSEDL